MKTHLAVLASRNKNDLVLTLVQRPSDLDFCLELKPVLGEVVDLTADQCRMLAGALNGAADVLERRPR